MSRLVEYGVEGKRDTGIKEKNTIEEKEDD